MELFLAPAILAVVLYAVFMGYTSWRWKKMPDTTIPESPPETFVSVVIPARNEAGNIVACVGSILQQEYPADLSEVIIVDDHSDDATCEQIGQFADDRIKAIRADNQSFGKKKALEAGIGIAKGALIVTTDADCTAPPKWLATIVAVYESRQSAIIASPVIFQPGQRAIEHFQCLDFVGTMVLTGVGIRHRWFYLGNGANLAFPKSIFEALNGYSDIDHIASGDDLLFIHKVAHHYPSRIHFNKSLAATVSTQPQQSLRSLFWQRIRWAGKSGAYTDRPLQLILLMVFSVNAFVLLSPLALLFTPSHLWLPYAGILGLKVLADLVLLETGMRYFQQTPLRRFFLIAQLYHLVYVAAIGPLSLVLKKYPWKGRKVQ